MARWSHGTRTASGYREATGVGRARIERESQDRSRLRRTGEMNRQYKRPASVRDWVKWGASGHEEGRGPVTWARAAVAESTSVTSAERRVEGRTSVFGLRLLAGARRNRRTWVASATTTVTRG